MFEDILGTPEEPRDLSEISDSTIIVCPECGVEMISMIFIDDDNIQMIDNDYPCKKCSGEGQMELWDKQ